tara:strand:- start:18737 stop:20470 length:1734 start_codon:yes stop_codon:yes gene_type:complete
MAQESSFFSKIAEILGTPISNFISGIDSVNISSTQLGIDDGIIAGAIFSVARKVERNPKSQNDDDKYLVKDTMKLGFRLGAGLIVGGSASYVQEWTIVYPVQSSLKGVLHNKFFVDLFLPYKVWKSKLPEKYTLITDTYIEGQARLKLGGGAVFPVGTEINASKIKLKRTFLSKKSHDKITVFEEVGKYYQLAHSIYAQIPLISIPIFDGVLQSGKTTREFKDVLWTQLDMEQKSSFFYNVLFNNKVKIDDKNQMRRVVDNKFHHKYSYFNLLWIMTEESNTREDFVTDTLYAGDEIIQQRKIYQIEDVKKFEWTSFFDRESSKSRVFYSAVPKTNHNDMIQSMESPELTITLHKKDITTKQDEVDNVYLPLMNKLTEQESWKTNQFQLDETLSKETLFSANLKYNEDALKILSNLDDNMIFKRVEEMTGKNRIYWERAARNGFHSRDMNRLRNSRLTLRDVWLAKQLSSIARDLKNHRKVESQKSKIRYFIQALKKSLLLGKGAFDDVIISMLNSFVPHNMRSAHVSLTQWPKDEPKENDSKNALIIEKSSGPKLVFRVQKHRFYFENNSQIYHLL